MKKYMKTTLGRKLLAFYLIMFTVSFYLISTIGYNYISDRVFFETAGNLRSVGVTLLSSRINQQRYTKDTIRSLRTQLEVAAEAAECRIMIVYIDGSIIVDTNQESTSHNVFQGEYSYLYDEYTKETTMDGYLDTESLCVTIPLEQNPYFNGYLILTQPTKHILTRTTYYSNILATFFYFLMAIAGLIFLLIYIFNVRPLHKLRNSAKDFSVGHENPPICIHSNDEYGELAQTLNVIGEELSKFDEYQRKFISNISHDFRSPLTNIQGYIQAMADGIIPPENQEKYLNIILYETERLTKLTSDLIDVNNYDRDTILLNLSSFDIHEAIRKTCDSLEGTANRKQIHLQQQFSTPSTLMVQADQDKIMQVLHNLMDNAIKFSSSGSSVLIRTWTKGEKVFISVKDSGIGIPKEETNRIWDRFYKTDLSRGKDKLGSGLGLSICKQIITAHKQTIDVVSTIHVGSEFVFTLQKSILNNS